jgi:hypothetical protein
MSKPILCLDFDGVCHSYTSGWKGAAVIPDEAVPGLFEFLEQAAPIFDIQVFSSRSNQDGGIEAMQFWFYEQRKKWRANGGQGSEIVSISFPTEKPAAFITLDDRAITFSGVFPDVNWLRSFQPWYRAGVPTPRAGDTATPSQAGGSGIS